MSKLVYLIFGIAVITCGCSNKARITAPETCLDPGSKIGVDVSPTKLDLGNVRLGKEYPISAKVSLANLATKQDLTVRSSCSCVNITANKIDGLTVLVHAAYKPSFGDGADHQAIQVMSGGSLVGELQITSTRVPNYTVEPNQLSFGSIGSQDTVVKRLSVKANWGAKVPHTLISNLNFVSAELESSTGSKSLFRVHLRPGNEPGPFTADLTSTDGTIHVPVSGILSSNFVSDIDRVSWVWAKSDTRSRSFQIKKLDNRSLPPIRVLTSSKAIHAKLQRLGPSSWMVQLRLVGSPKNSVTSGRIRICDARGVVLSIPMRLIVV